MLKKLYGKSNESGTFIDIFADNKVFDGQFKVGYSGNLLQLSNKKTEITLQKMVLDFDLAH